MNRQLGYIMGINHISNSEIEGELANLRTDPSKVNLDIDLLQTLIDEGDFDYSGLAVGLHKHLGSSDDNIKLLMNLKVYDNLSIEYYIRLNSIFNSNHIRTINGNKQDVSTLTYSETAGFAYLNSKVGDIKKIIKNGESINYLSTSDYLLSRDFIRVVVYGVSERDLVNVFTASYRFNHENIDGAENLSTLYFTTELTDLDEIKEVINVEDVTYISLEEYKKYM